MGKSKNFAKRTHRSLSKDKNISKKNVFDNLGKLPTKTTVKVPKRIP
jgi:hypothetical protein